MARLSFLKVRDFLFSFNVLMPIIMLIGVTLIFLPYGLGQLGLIEEWGELGVFSEHGPMYFITKHTQMAHTRMRPLNMLPPSLGYRLDPDSFVYWHILQFLFIWLKGIGMGLILWWLYPQRWVAILGGLLMMLYPADTMQLSLRSIHINGAVAYAICACACLLWATEAKKLWTNAVLAGCGSFLFLVASLTYETAFFLAPLPLIFWWAKYGLREGWKSLKTQRIVVSFWLAAILIELGYLLWVGRDPDLYQSHLSNTPWATFTLFYKNLPMLFSVGFYRTLLHSWYDAGRMFLIGGDWIIFLPIAVILILLLVLCFFAKDFKAERKAPLLEARFLKRCLVASILVIALGYSPYLLLGTHILITQRTYLFAGIGGTLFFASIIAVLQDRFRWAGAGMAGCLLLLGITAQWTQFEHYEAISDKQKSILSGILEVAPRLNSKQNLLIIDHTGSLGSTWMLRGEILSSALTYLYGKKTDATICMEPGSVRSTFATDAAGRTGRCEEQQDTWQIGQGFPGSFSLPKAQLVTLIIEPDSRIHLKENSMPISSATPSERARWTKLFGCWPANTCYTKNEIPPFPDHFKFNFGKWWSMEEPTPGVGWIDSQWIVPALLPRSFSWINQPKSTLIFNLSPRAEPYLMEIRFAYINSQAVKESLKILVNGHSIQYHWLNEVNAQAQISPNLLKEGVNKLLFLTDTKHSQGVGLGVEYVKIEPQK
ncbi:MAG TPA: hypothetical protein VMW10_02675 [Alphaproteobacteria bacterium]|nr:hypothetical protein [Alphaproteobacteria bacterium]